MRSSCSAGVRPSGLLVADAFADLRAEAGDADHEELVEVIGGDRQEFKPLEQRVLPVGRFFEHAAIEVQPGQLTVDKPVRTGQKIRRGMARAGLRHALFGAPQRRGFSRSSSCLAAVGHGFLVLLEGDIGHYATIL